MRSSEARASENGSRSANGRLPDDHLEQHHPERVEVGALVGGTAHPLLGSDVARRAEELARLAAGVGVGTLQPGDAEVEDLDRAARREHHVGGLEVAVQDAVAVRHAQRLGQLHGDRHRLAFAERALGQARGQRLAVDELEDDGHFAIHLDDVVDGGDRRDG